MRTDIPLLAFLIGCTTQASSVEHLPYYGEETFTPQWHTPDTVPEDFHRVSDFSLTNQRGETITEEAMAGQVTVVNFFFATCSGICSKLSASMKKVDAAFPADTDLMLLSHSVTPGQDTVEALADFAARERLASSRWHLLTGDRSVIYGLGRSDYFVEEDLGEPRSADDFLHTESIVLIDGDRRLRGVYNGLQSGSVQQLIADIQTLLEAQG